MNSNGNLKQKQISNLLAMMTGFMIGVSILLFANAQEPETSGSERETYPIGATTGVETTEVGAGSTKSGSVSTVKLITKSDKGESTENQGTQETNQGGGEFVLNRGNDFAKEVASYLWGLNPDKKMIATFIAESGLNPRSHSYTNDYGICQLSYQYNKGWIDNPLWTSNWKRQAERCVEKRKNANPNIWVAYKSGAYKKYLDLIK